MSKSRIAMAMAGVAMVALGVLPSAAEAGVRLRIGGPVGVARFAMASMLSVAGLRRARMAARHSRVRDFCQVRQARRHKACVSLSYNAGSKRGLGVMRGRILGAVVAAGVMPPTFPLGAFASRIDRMWP